MYQQLTAIQDWMLMFAKDKERYFQVRIDIDLLSEHKALILYALYTRFVAIPVSH